MMEKRGISVSLFIEPEKDQIDASKSSGVSMIELHTGSYANAKNETEVKKEFDILKKASIHAKKIGLNVFAGHGLNYENTKPLTSIKEIEEYNMQDEN